MKCIRMTFFLYFCCVAEVSCKRVRNKYVLDYHEREFMKLKTSSLLCPAGTILKSNTSTLDGVNCIRYWYPWVHRVFPRCWEALRPLLCLEVKKNFMLPQRIFYRPCKRVCQNASYSCWMLKQFVGKIVKLQQLNNDEFMNCKQYNDNKCKANFTYSKTVCSYPLHESYHMQDLEIVHKYGWEYLEKSVSGCSLLCDSPLKIHQPYHKNVYMPIVIFCCIGLFISMFTMLTFLVDWKCQKRYPAVILFILNALFVLCLIGWLIQFFGIGNSIRCSPDNYRRLKEPKYRKTSWCMVSFILIYFSSTAISCWFVILTYSWYISFKALGTTKNCINGKIKYFHLIAWSISIFFTGIVIFLREVDSHPFTNICFLGYSNKTIRINFVYIPYFTSLILGEIFIVCSTKVLIQLRVDCSLFLVPRAAKNITHTIQRLILYGLITMVVVMAPMICYIFEDYNDKEWTSIYIQYIKCLIVKSTLKKHPLYPEKCFQPDSRKLMYFYLELSCLFLACVATNSWTWTNATCRIWVKQWRKISTNDAQQQLQISWYGRMQKKKITPFVPPVDPANPLETNMTRRHSEKYGLNINPLTNDNQSTNVQNRKNSDDIRSVLELFSARRCTKVSIESEDDQSLHLPGIKRSKSVTSLQNYGHLAYGNINQDCNVFRKMSSNMTLMQIKNNIENVRCSSNLTLTHLKNVRDNVFTPISLVHKDNIVADCIPYASMQAVHLADKSINHSINQSFSWNQGMEPCSVSSADEL